ncbi:MAG TPA: response regulator [Ktedonobacteraceae bacterium]|nr:response regulator [Ktedonobacteraceae bacterium]
MKKRIVVAEDDSGVSDALQMILEDAGYEVETIVHGTSMYRLRNPLPGLLLLDIWLGGTDGREICKFLKSQGTTQHLPIILLSAQRGIQAIAKEAGADNYLAKPFEIDALLALVAQYMD